MNHDKEIMKKADQSGEYSPIESRVINHASTNTINELSDEVLMGQVKSLVSGITSMVGLKNVTRNEITLLVDFLRKYYFSFSISEIKLAFELAVVGELDNYLPRDRDGRPDRNHYQMLSMEYVGKILNAYKKLRSKVKIKVYKNRAMNKGLKSGESAKNRASNVRYLVACFERYKRDGDEPQFIVPHVYSRYLHESGLISEMPEITEDDRREVWNKIQNTGVIDARNEKGTIGEVIDRKAGRNAHYKKIMEVFNKLIHNGESLGDYFDV